MSNLKNLSSYDYKLPREMIAQEAHLPADECKLLINNKWIIKDAIFSDIADIFDKNTVLYFNNSKVIKSRIPLSWSKYTNSRWREYNIKNGEIFFLNKISDNQFEALVNPGEKFKLENKIFFPNDIYFEVIKYTKKWRILQINNTNIDEFLEQYGLMPLPTYISYNKDKETPYQPIFAKNPGSVASPTASLHFTEKLFQKLTDKWVNFNYLTLHIWLGTFQAVDTENIEDFNIHSEKIVLDDSVFDNIYDHIISGRQIIWVGTTSTRILESLPYLWISLKEYHNNTSTNRKEVALFWDELTKKISTEKVNEYIHDIEFGPISFNTKLFIYTWFEFRIIKHMITNFHLPKSSLLMMISTFMGHKNMLDTYQHAIENNYRFFSFGDAMLILK